MTEEKSFWFCIGEEDYRSGKSIYTYEKSSKNNRIKVRGNKL